MRALVTGGNGFVGRHLCNALREHGYETTVAVHTHEDQDVVPDASQGEVLVELRDLESLREVLERGQPHVIFHLGAQSFVPAATRDPLEAFDVNALGTARLFEAIRSYCGESPPRVLYASSAEVYGEREPHEFPVTELVAPHPVTPYAASKLSGEAIAFAWRATYGIPTVVTRAFNHIGPGQSGRFAVPSFARGLAEIALGAPPLLGVGNLEIERDFLDVRDVVSAYIALAERGRDGEVYNVCSGKPLPMREILRQLIMIARVPVEVREDPALLRPRDVPVSFGSNAKLRAATGWEPHVPLARSLRDVYDDARERLAFAT